MMCSFVFDKVLEVVDLISQGLHFRVMDFFHVLLQSRSQPEECIALAAFETTLLWEPSCIGPTLLPWLMGRVPWDAVPIPFASR